MKNNFLLFLILYLITSTVARGQKQNLTNLGMAYTLESNVGFHGLMFTLDEEVKIKQKLSIIFSGNFFTSNRIPDRKVGTNQFNRSFITDVCLQFNPKGLEKGFFFNFGPTFRYTKTRQTVSYSINQNGEPFDIKYIRTESNAIGFKIGLGYKIPITKSLNSSLYVDCRVIDNVPEPTFLGIGYKIGF
jgi:hypothetical protein